MERQYKAFISYRHLPLDKETAIQVHRAIEHFVIPRSLRKDGQRKLGYVFRDEDELPVAGELTENIRLALENSEYLIVICTPETCKSAWVLKEVETFLQLRDRNHILLVLADGEPAESFPRVITELRDESGRVLPLPELDREDPVPGFAIAHAQMVWLGDEALELYDLERGELLWQVPLPVPAGSLVHMSFFRDDSLLLLFTQQGDALICDAASGELLSRCGIGNSSVSLYRDTAFTLRELPERGQLLIFVNEQYYTESFYLLLDTESWTLLEACSAPLGYDAANERMLVMVRYKGLYSAPLYTREELLALAQQRVAIQDR